MWNNSDAPLNPSLAHGFTGFIHHPQPREARPVFRFSDSPASPADAALSLPTPSSSPVPRSKDPGSRLTIEQLARYEAESGDSDTFGRALDALPPRGSGYNLVTINREEENEHIVSARSFGYNEINDAYRHARDLYGGRVVTQPEPPKIAKPVQSSSAQAYLTPPSSPETEPENGSPQNGEVDDFSLDAESTLVDDCPNEPLSPQELIRDDASSNPKLSDSNFNESLELDWYEEDDDDYLEYDYDSDDDETATESPNEVNDPIVQESTSTSTHLADLRNLTSSLVKLPDLTPALDHSSFPEWSVARGGFGEVWKGDIMCDSNYDNAKVTSKASKPKVSRRTVAVKRLKMYTDGGDEGVRKTLKRTAREIHIWSRLHHRNVLPLLGFCAFRGGIGIVSPWQEAGNVTAWVNSNPGVDRLELCEGICAGLAYLHESNVIHGDLRGANVLISPCGAPRLIDFGLATIVDGIPAFSESSSMAGTVRWMAPELQVVENHGITRESDIFALGMTMLEMHTGGPPFSRIKNDYAVLLKYQQGERPQRPEAVYNNHTRDCGSKGTRKPTVCVPVDDNTWGLLRRCWDQNPRDRPTARNALGAIRRQRKRAR